MSFARSLSLLFWLLCPITIFLFYTKRWGFFYSTLAAIFILLPSEPYMLLDIVNVTPDSMMAFLFTCSLILAEFNLKNERSSWNHWLLLGAVAALSFFAKQQGIIAIGCIVPFLLLRKASFKQLISVLIGFLLVFAASSAYLEYVNYGHYLQTTIFKLKQIMPDSPSSHILAEERLYAFVISHNLAFTICAALSFFALVLRFNKITIWQVSFIVHLFFLLKILGNGGGGPNYFLTFWISTVVVCLELISKFSNPKIGLLSPYFLVTEKAQARLYLFSKTILIGLFVSISIGTISIHRQLNSSIYPSPELAKIMQDYYQTVADLVASKPNAKVLTNRNVGALAATSVNIENEGSTMFQYAWAHGEIFQSDFVLSAIRTKQYDFITSGLQNYPPNVAEEIQKNYKVAIVKEEILQQGNVGLSTVYVPK
jgi:4-amino-4-deoxy-L-arabinose transferase-like glycosyltransferase